MALSQDHIFYFEKALESILLLQYYLYESRDYELNNNLLLYHVDQEAILNVTRIGVSLMTHSYQEDNKGK